MHDFPAGRYNQQATICIQFVRPNMRRKLKLLIFLLLSSNWGYAQSHSFDAKIFTVEELRADFTYWRDRLEQKHPLIYLYTPKYYLDSCFASIYQAINHPMNELEFYKLISPLPALIKDGHNFIIPSKQEIAILMHSDRLLPLDLTYIDRKLYVTLNLGSAEDLSTGMEIISINNISAEQMLNTFQSGMHRDGENLQLPNALLRHSFRFYFHLYYGISETYVMEYRNTSGDVMPCTLPGSTLDAIKKVKLSRYGNPENAAKFGLRLSIVDSLKAAVIAIRTFDAKTLKQTYHQNFKREVSAYFELIRKKGISNLILDLRDNGGGDPNYVKFILRNVLAQPFAQAIECRIVKDGSQGGFSERTRKKWYPWYGIGSFKPLKNSFKGNLYVLVNEGTFSSGVILASVLRKYNRAVFIGSETGGNPIIMGGYLLKTVWELPNTKMQVSPATLCTMYDAIHRNTGSGLIPDYIIKPTPQDLLAPGDRCLNYTYELIRNKK